MGVLLFEGFALRSELCGPNRVEERRVGVFRDSETNEQFWAELWDMPATGRVRRAEVKVRPVDRPVLLIPEDIPRHLIPWWV